MKKRIVSWLLIIVTIFASIPSGFANGQDDNLKGMDYIAERLSTLTKEDRRNLETIFIPIIITDSGLDTLKKTISEYSEDSESFMHSLLKKLFVRIDKEELLQAVSYLYMIDEDIRQEYIGGYYERKTISLTNEQKKAMTELFDLVFEKYPELEKVFEEDSITCEVVARVLCMFAKNNGDIPLLKENALGKLEVNICTEDLNKKIENCIFQANLPFDSTSEFLNEMCNKINEKFSEKEMKNFIAVSSAVGIVKAAAGQIQGNSDKEISKPGINSENIYTSTVEKSMTGDSLIVSAKDSSGKILENGTYPPFYISFSYEEEGYLIDPNGEKVRFCISDNGVWYAILDKTGTYEIVKSGKKYFDDVDGWGKETVNALYERGIISGRGNNMFCPDDNITREEFVTLIVQMFAIDGEYENTFDDVLKNEWYYRYVSAAKYYGLVNGYGNGKFGIGEPITRQDMAKILYSLIVSAKINIDTDIMTTEFYDRQNISDYAYDAVMALKRVGIVNGDEKGCFKPQSNATRREAAVLIYNILSMYVKE